MIYIPSDDSFLLASCIPWYAQHKRVLDMGSGSGILAETALKAGAASVLAADIDKESLLHLRKKGITVQHSDLFSKIKGSFDIILCNPPYLPRDKREDAASQRATTGGRHGDEFILRFLKQAQKHLALRSSILLLLSSLTPRRRILVLLKKSKMKHRAIAEKKLFFEKLEVWEIKCG